MLKTWIKEADERGLSLQCVANGFLQPTWNEFAKHGVTFEA